MTIVRCENQVPAEDEVLRPGPDKSVEVVHSVKEVEGPTIKRMSWTNIHLNGIGEPHTEDERVIKLTEQYSREGAVYRCQLCIRPQICGINTPEDCAAFKPLCDTVLADGMPEPIPAENAGKDCWRAEPTEKLLDMSGLGAKEYTLVANCVYRHGVTHGMDGAHFHCRHLNQRPVDEGVCPPLHGVSTTTPITP
jgi:hypothetical protein